MNKRLFSLFLLTVIASLALVSAAVSFDILPPSAFTKTINSTQFTIRNTGNETASFTIPSNIVISDGVNNLNVVLTSYSFSLINGTNQIINASISSVDFNKLKLGEHSKTINIIAINSTIGSNQTKPITFSAVKSFCSLGEQGSDLSVDVDINNKKGYGEDTEWYPLDEIEIDVDVENTGDDDIRKIVVQWCLYNPVSGKCILDDKEESFKLKEDGEKTVTLNFQLDPNDIDEDVDDYIFYVKVYSKDVDFGEDALCTEFSENINVVRDNNFVVLNNVQLPADASCDSEIEVSADVWNIGEDDENDVYVMLTNSELGIKEQIDIGDIDTLDKESFSKTIKIPANSTSKTYLIKMVVFDEDDDVFENDNDDKAEYTFPIKIECAAQIITNKNAEISASLETAEDQVKSGNEVIIKATIKNTGEEKTIYTLALSGYEDFASVKSISPITLTLEPGKTQDALITLQLNKDAEGEKIFSIKALFDSEEVEQQVSLSIAKSGFSITGSAIGASLKENWFIWVVVAINIILIIAIIIVAVKMSRAS